MAELLVRVKDKINEDFYRNAHCSKRGDVIVVQEDGWAWGRDELNLPFYRIIRVPLTVSEASVFLAPEINQDPQQPSKTLQRRAFKLDLDNPSIPVSVKTALQDDTRIEKVKDMGLIKQEVLSLKVTKAAIADPAIIGSGDL